MIWFLITNNLMVTSDNAVIYFMLARIVVGCFPIAELRKKLMKSSKCIQALFKLVGLDE